jgi:2-phosphosulfolactate phosphatase
MRARISLELKATDADKIADRGDVIIVIDVLRCGTSIVNALTNGVQSIVPTATLKEAYKLHSQHANFLLVGERRGLKPKGFDLGNSPLEFTSERVFGKNLIMTTTSGTMALVRSKRAEWVFVGAFLNSGSVAGKTIEVAEKQGKGVSLILSGEKGKFSLEDFTCAGAIVERFPRNKVSFSDGILASLLAFKQTENNLCKTIMEAEHAKHLIKMGFRNDIEFSCQLDILREVPIYRDGKITLLK